MTRTPERAAARGYRDLFAFWARCHGARSAALAALEERVLLRFARDRARFSDILEPSFSWTPGGRALYRFSYAFPGFRADPAEAARGLLDLCAPFGDAALAHARRLLRAARHAAVRQPLFGVALDPDGARRLKLYLQFDDAAERGPIELAEQILGCRLADRLPSDTSLHLLGIDLGARGVLAAKLYLVHPPLDADEAAARIGPTAILAALRAAGRRALRGVLSIYRVEDPGSPLPERPAEIDLPLAENGLSWTAVREALPARDALDRGAIAALFEAFPLRVRRISTPVGRDDKLNVYYVLDDGGGSARAAAPPAREGEACG